MINKAKIVLGLGYGDEGKGLVTDYLCKGEKNAIVVRFNGGQQAGHTVITDTNERHVFSNLGSGTFRGVPTYWSHYCTFSPAFFLSERDLLKRCPTIYIDRFSPVTTHYDVLYNRAIETSRGELRHGSCGLGFGATVQRHSFSDVTFFVQDLLTEMIWKEKLKGIRDYYRYKITDETPFNFDQFSHDEEDSLFREDIDKLKDLVLTGAIQFVTEKEILSAFSSSTLIFEGAQGILLDPKYGIWPYVTKSSTTSENALSMLRRHPKFATLETEIYYVTRAYQTRHGAGPFNDHSLKIDIQNNLQETNKFNYFQGEFKIAPLNIEQLNYAIACDNYHAVGLHKHLIVTCVDQLKSQTLPVYINGLARYLHVAELPSLISCEFKSSKFSYSACSEYLL